jgi:CheY-like chemotaxis protein
MPSSPQPVPTVLLVEDDPNDRLILQHAFGRSAPGVQLQITVDGEHAEDYLSGKRVYSDRSAYPLPHVVLMDLKLPRKSGLEVLEWMRKDAALTHIPVFILSSSQERNDIERAYDLGANSYLVKQVDIKVVREIASGIAAYASLVLGRPLSGGAGITGSRAARTPLLSLDPPG